MKRTNLNYIGTHRMCSDLRAGSDRWRRCTPTTVHSNPSKAGSYAYIRRRLPPTEVDLLVKPVVDPGSCARDWRHKTETLASIPTPPSGRRCVQDFIAAVLLQLRLHSPVSGYIYIYTLHTCIHTSSPLFLSIFFFLSRYHSRSLSRNKDEGQEWKVWKLYNHTGLFRRYRFLLFLYIFHIHIYWT